MPMDRSKYPEDWELISMAIRVRADFKCEQCGAPHGAGIIRDPIDPGQWRIATDEDVEDGAKIVTVVLTVHHIGAPKPDGSPGDARDKMDCRPENLIALCQRCHLVADLENHIATAHRTRRLKALEAGQMELL